MNKKRPLPNSQIIKRVTLLFLFCLALVPAMAQNNHGGHNCGNCPHHGKHTQSSCSNQSSCNKDGIAMEVVSVFPTAKTIKKDTKWTIVYDAQKKVIGYVVYSKPASNGIKGYAGETPLMIALTPEKKIVGVTMLDNSETPGYLRKIVDAGLLKSWDGMKVKKAKKKKVDTVAGATFTSKSIIETFQAALKNID